uniref:Uncharacterized protein n=1 Tax=Triticum urartu TaxID=4572 RepID=A0A8R7UHC5_TRIUA
CGAHLETLGQIADVGVRRAPLPHGRPRFHRERTGLAAPLLAILPAVHGAPHRGLHRLPPNHDILLIHPVHHWLLHPDADADPQHLHRHLLVQELVREVRPRHHRQPRRDRLQRRVPAAVRHERARRAVRQDERLRRPPPDEQSTPRDALLELAEEGERGLVVAAGVLDHPDERVARRLQPQAELRDLLRVRVRDAAEADVDHGAGLPVVEPPDAVVGVDCRGVPSRRQRCGVLVVERHRPHGPHLHRPRGRVAGDVLGLHLHEGVHDDAVGLGPRALHVVGELLPPGPAPEEAGGLRPRHLEPLLQPRHDDRVVVVEHAVVGVEPLDVVLAEDAEGAHAEEAEPGDAEAGRELHGPRVAEVGHDACRWPGRAVAEVGLDRPPEERDGGEVGQHVLRGEVVHVVRPAWNPVGQADRGVVEREVDEADWQAGAPGGFDGGAHPRRRGRRGDDGAERALSGQQQRGVDGGDDVPLGH